MAHPRVVHCMVEPYDVYVGRGPCPKTGIRGPWGNPFKPGQVDDAILAYFGHVARSPGLLAACRAELPGKVLGCWCAAPTKRWRRCHGDVLVLLADGLSTPEVLKELLEIKSMCVARELHCEPVAPEREPRDERQGELFEP